MAKLHDDVTLPEGEDVNEWLATNTIDFFNDVNVLFGLIAEFCTDSAFPVMSAGPKFEYMWADGVEFKKPASVSARLGFGSVRVGLGLVRLGLGLGSVRLGFGSIWVALASVGGFSRPLSV